MTSSLKVSLDPGENTKERNNFQLVAPLCLKNIASMSNAHPAVCVLILLMYVLQLKSENSAISANTEIEDDVRRVGLFAYDITYEDIVSGIATTA